MEKIGWWNNCENLFQYGYILVWNFQKAFKIKEVCGLADVKLGKEKNGRDNEIAKMDKWSCGIEGGNWLMAGRRFGMEELGKFLSGETKKSGGKW